MLFLPAAVLVHPAGTALMRGLGHPLQYGTGYLDMLAANVGAVIMPWMVFYQQQAVADNDCRGLGHQRALRAAGYRGGLGRDPARHDRDPDHGRGDHGQNNDAPRRAPWFYGVAVGGLAVGAAVALLAPDLVSLSVDVEILNACLLTGTVILFGIFTALHTLLS